MGSGAGLRALAFTGVGLAVAAAGRVAPVESEPVQAVAEVTLQEETRQADPLPYYLALPAADTIAERELLERLERAVLPPGGQSGTQAAPWSPEPRNDGQRADPPADAALADSILESLPALGDWAPLLRAEILSRASDVEGVRDALDELDPVLGFGSAWGWRIQVDAFERAEDLDGGREAAEELAAAEPNPATSAALWLRAGEFALASGDTARARENLWKAVGTGDRFEGARDAAVIVDRIAEPAGDEEALVLGRALLAAAEWEAGRSHLAPLLSSDLLSPTEADELRLDLGRALFQLRRYAEAAALLDPLVRSAAPSEATVSALFWTGRAALARGALDEAAAAFGRVSELEPGSSMALEGLLLLLERERQSGLGPRVATLLDRVLDAGVAASAETAVTQLGAQSYLAADYSRARGVFDRYLEGSRSSAGRQQAAYWSALARERTGDRADGLWTEAHATDPYSYYGLLAGERLGLPVLPSDLAQGPGPVPGIELETRNALLRLRVLRILDIPGTVAREIERLSTHFHARGDGAYDFADALIARGFPLEGVSLGRQIYRREGEWNLRLLRIVHPFPYRETVIEEARARGLDPFLVAGLIRQESLYHAPIVSTSGAVGLMQLMPPTAREVAATLRIQYSPQMLTDPETNIRMGTTYLAGMVRMFPERVDDVLSAYNAGPGRARGWQRLATHGDRDVFLEQIPIQETRNYVRLVQQYARMYAALYGCADFGPCLGISYRDVPARSNAL